MRLFFLALGLVGVLLPNESRAEVPPSPLNEVVREQLETMPTGGGYSASSTATRRLQEAARFEAGKFVVQAADASPSYCSGATYLVFLKTIQTLRDRGALKLDEATLAALQIRGQPDGAGIWGRWNANGPGTARLFYELGIGRNFDDFAQAQAGDFMKIFWSPEVGRAEHGHSVIFLGMETRGGREYVHFWSSNIPGGYGDRTVPRSRIAHAIFSRLDRPENLDRISSLPRVDRYLASLEHTRSSYEEARKECGF